MADTDEAAAIWSRAKELLLSNNSLSERYKSCISEITPFRCFDNMIVLEATNEFTRLTIENNISNEVIQALKIAAGKDMTFLIHLVSSNSPAASTNSTSADDPNDAIAIASQAHQRNAVPTPATMARQTTQPQNPTFRGAQNQRPGAQHPGTQRHQHREKPHNPQQGTLFDLDAFPRSNAGAQPTNAQQNFQSPAQGFAAAQGTQMPQQGANNANGTTMPGGQNVPGTQTNPYGTNPYDDYSAYPDADMPSTTYDANQGAPGQDPHGFAPLPTNPANGGYEGQAQSAQQPGAGVTPAQVAYRNGAQGNPRQMPAPRRGNQMMGPASPAAYASGYQQHGDMQMSTPRMNRDEETHLNKLATFDTFVAGDSNRFAHAVALAVAETPGKLYNPLCIYGGPGLGKTHLLNAIGNEALRENPSLKVRYANSEEFTNEFIEALRTSSTDPNGVTNFNRRYREVDILLIDDIQFLRGEETMRQFFHTFNALHQANKQIVIASDVAPKNLKGFEQRLISRFDSGLSVDVRPPDLETRIAILRMKAQTSGMEVPNDVLNLIAEQVTDNVRELEGALTRVHAMASLNKQPLTRALAEQTLQDFFSSDVEITPTDIITTTAQYFQLTFDDLVGTSRTKNIAMARQIAMYMAREMTSLSLVDIGEIFGGRDHSTVMHACRKISSEMSEKREVYNYVTELTVLIKRKDSTK